MHFRIKKYYFIDFGCLFLKSLKAFSVSLKEDESIIIKRFFIMVKLYKKPRFF